MKRLINIFIIATLTGAPLSVYGQRGADDDPVIRIFNRYEDREGVESVTISPALLGLRTNDSRTQELISKISGLRILSLTDRAGSSNRATREALTAELQTVVRSDFEEIMMVRSAGERVELYVRNRDGRGALLFIVSGANSITVMHLAGTIDKTLIDAVMSGEIGISN